MSAEKVYWSLNRRELLKLLPPGVAGWVLGPLAGEKLLRAAVGVPTPPVVEAKKWVAKWIWCEGEPVPQNFYLYCRKSFTLEGEVSEATIDVAADSRYKLFVNGKFAGRGPVRSDQRWQYYDTYDLRPLLRRGENVVAAIVHQFGIATGSYTLGRGGFLLQGEVRGGSGRGVRLDSDESWRVLPAPPWDREAARATPAIMWQEVYDARKEPLGWQEPGFDDSSWQRPVILGTPPVVPWENLVARDIPFLREEEWRAAAIVNSGLVEVEPLAVQLDMPKLLGRSDGEVAYLFAYLKSPVEQQIALAIRGRDGMPPMFTRFWVNGQTPGREPNPPMGPATPVSVVQLRQGWNELLLKLGRLSPAWSWELTLGPAPGQKFAPVELYSEQDTGTGLNHAWLAGPYGQGGPRPGQPGPGGMAFMNAHEPERVVLGRAPGSAVHFPGKVIPLDLGPPKNVALLMAVEKRQPQATPALRDVEKLLKPGEGPCWVSTAGAGGNPYITIDFGKEVAGYVRFRLKGVAGGIVDLGYSETLLNGHVDPLRNNEGVNYADRYVMRDGPQAWELFFWKGFRYLQLTFRNCSKPVAVESVDLLFTSYPVKYRGSFECSDALLTKIWDVGRWTLQLCMHDGYEDCPWREQSQWVGDAQVELESNYVTFGDLALGAKYFRQIAQGQGENGSLPASYPAGVAVYPKRQPMPVEATLPTFMVQWVSTLLAYYRYTGERKLVSELFPTVERVLAYFDRRLDDHGLLANVPGFTFLDWTSGLQMSPQGSPGELTGLNCHYYRGLLDAAELAVLVGNDARRAEWTQKAERVKQSVNDRLWSEEKGVYVPGRMGDQVTGKLAVHESVLAAYAGVAPEERIKRSLDTLFGKPPAEAIQIGSPYFYFAYLQALRRAGRHEQALAVTREAYGKMLEAGATTWWEHLGGFASLCHAWSTAPNSDLSRYVLGVQLTEPGYAAFRVEPYPADLTWAKGVIPTVHGDVAVAWKREGSSFELTVTAPMKAVVELSVPAKSLETTRLTSKAKPQKQAFTDGRARYWVEGPGTFRVEAQG